MYPRSLSPRAERAGGERCEVAGVFHESLARRQDGTWEGFNNGLPAGGGRVAFLDVNGDGLLDAVESGFADGRSTRT
jgi:hypothetical protein